MSFKDNSPIVSSDGVTAYVTANRPGVELYCQIMKVDRNRENCKFEKTIIFDLHKLAYQIHFL